MGEIKIEDKTIVVPGEELAVGMDFLPATGTFRENEKIIAQYIGLVNIDKRLIKVIPLSGKYIPKEGDTVIGRISNMNLSGWLVDIGFVNEANLSLRDASSDYIEKGSDLTQYFNFGDHIITKITRVFKGSLIELTMKGPGLRKIRDGKIIEVNPKKVPRIIGKQGSMVSLVKEKTKCRITVGQNGRVWINGENPISEIIATKAIKEIENKAHIQGLTDQITKFLDKECKENGIY
jgi:exosome complex component RRP4